MNNQISAETLSPITHQNIPVITTELLAQLYGTEAIRIQQNHTRNKTRFVEGKHYVKVTGKALADLRLSLSESQNLQPSLRGLQISPKARSLILWTERGAARHAKMLETDQAWEVFEKLEDCYFTKKAEPVAAVASPPQHKCRYYGKVIVWDRLTNKCIELDGEADTLKQVACGIARDLGYEPVSTLLRKEVFADGDDFITTARRFAEVAKKRGYMLVKTVA